MRLWEEFLQGQAKDLGPEALDKWAKSLKIVHFDAGNLYLEAHDAFQVNWFEEHLRPKIVNFRNNNQRPIKVHLTLANSPKEKKIWKPLLNLAPDTIDPASRFETYFSGATNQISFSLLKDALEKSLYNPIYLHGPEGVGKSHLLMAAAFDLTSRGKKCFYVKAGTLTNHIVAAIRSSAMQKFRDLYRQHDVLLVDDIHHLANRSATQEELFHTFNTLHIAGKQILLAGRCLPSQLEGIEPRLTSRFEWGLVLPFQPLNSPERKDFFKQKVLQKNMVLTEQIEDFLLTELTTVKSLCACLDILQSRKNIIQRGGEFVHFDNASATDLQQAQPTPKQAMCKHMADAGGCEDGDAVAVKMNKFTAPLYTLPLVQKWIEPLLEDQKKKLLTPEKIVQATAEIYEIRSPDILGRSQAQDCSVPRQVAMYLCRSLLKMPFLKIADVFSRDHSTVMTSVKGIEKKIGEHDEVVLSCINSIKIKLKS